MLDTISGPSTPTPEDARFLGEAVDAVRTRVERAPWRTPARRARFVAALDGARAVYRRIAGDAASAER